MIFLPASEPCFILPKISLTFHFARQTGFTVCSIYWPLRIFAPSLIFLPDTTPTTTPDLFASAAAASAEPVFSGLATGRDLVYIPLVADLSMHAAPFIALMLDFFLCERKFSWRQLNRVAPVIMLAYGTIYGSALEYLAKCDGYCECLMLKLSVQCRHPDHFGLV